MPSRQAQNGQVDHMSTLEQRWRVPCALARWSACIVALLTCVWGSASEVSRAANAGPQTLPHSELTLYYYDLHWTGGRDVCTPGDNWCGWATPAPKAVVYGTMTTTLPVPPGSTAVDVTIRIPCNGWGEGLHGPAGSFGVIAVDGEERLEAIANTMPYHHNGYYRYETCQAFTNSWNLHGQAQLTLVIEMRGSAILDFLYAAVTFREPPTPTPTATPSATPSPTPTLTATPTHTASPTPLPTPTATVLPARPRLRGMAYGPFRAGQDPNAGIFPSLDEVRADMPLLRVVANGVHTYGCQHQETVVTATGEVDMPLALGAWLTGDPASDQAELACVTQQANQHPHVTTLVVGNESILFNRLTPEQLCQVIADVQAQVDIPVSTGEPWSVWVQHPELAACVDYISAHIYPFWECIPIDQALAYVQAKYALLHNLYPDKPVVIGEVGWPTAGTAQCGVSIPNETNQVRFANEFLSWSEQAGLDFYWFEAFDEPWKCLEGRPDVECHWGIYDAARTPKPTRNLFLLCTPYDFNSDRIIDIVDIALVASRWLDPAAYDVRYDVAPPGAPDGVIDIADIAAVAGRFGQSCST